jgi:uncharacterized phage protein (TIGR02220 family)
MAIFRKIHTSFWSDTFIQDLDNDHKLFYLYLLTNERTKQCGIYEISKKQISFDLGYSIDRVSKLLKYFIDTNRIMYSEPTKELALRNWTKFNGSTSPKVVSCIKSELLNVKDRVLIEYVNGIYTASQQEQEEEQEEEQEIKNIVESIDYDYLLKYINDSLGRNFKIVNDKVKNKYKSLFKQGYTKSQIKEAIDNVKNNQYHKESNYTYCTLEFFSRPETIDKYSSVTKVENNEVIQDDYYLNIMKKLNQQ